MGDGGNEPGSTCLSEKHGGESGEACQRKRFADGAGRAGEGGEWGARGLRTSHATWVVSLERGTRKREYVQSCRCGRASWSDAGWDGLIRDGSFAGWNSLIDRNVGRWNGLIDGNVGRWNGPIAGNIGRWNCPIAGNIGRWNGPIAGNVGRWNALISRNVGRWNALISRSVGRWNGLVSGSGAGWDRDARGREGTGDVDGHRCRAHRTIVPGGRGSNGEWCRW
jgi:hypothetical protein